METIDKGKLSNNEKGSRDFSGVNEAIFCEILCRVDF